MKAHKGEFAVEKMCRVFGVSRSSYYDWLHRSPSRRALENELLKAAIKELHRQTKQRLGSPKLTVELRERGMSVSRPRVARLMRQMGIRSIISRRFRVVTTDSKHGHIPSENLLERDFTAVGPGQKWVSDITYVRTKQGWLYLTVIMDLYDRKVVGWSMSPTMEAEKTVVSAFRMAIKTRPVNPRELIFHSDRGIQYACDRFRGLLKANHIRQSMSRKGNCWDNAVAENFFKIIKSELVYHIPEPDLRQARAEIFEFIEIWYNRQRKHSHLNYMTPEQFGKENKKNAA